MAKKAPTARKPAPKQASKPDAKPAKAAAPKSSTKPVTKATAKHPHSSQKSPAMTSKAAKPPAAHAKTVAAKEVPSKASAAKGKESKPAHGVSKAASAPVAPAPVTAAAGAKPAAPATPGPPRPIKRPKPPQIPLKMPVMGKLLDPKNPTRKPLIPSGPKASVQRPLGSHGQASPETPKIEGKSPFNKRELDRFRTMLIRKRLELVGDVSTMENEALLGQSGSLSNTPSHMAEQGSEAYDQALSLDLAAADRRLIKEIDDALERIKSGVYGLCQLSGKPIKIDRLEELPWARYSIEAARELERQAMRS